MAYASDGKRLYIQGGLNGNTSVALFYTLDLTTSWNIAQPSWLMLPSSNHSGSAGSLDSKGRFIMTSGSEFIGLFESPNWRTINTNRKLSSKGPVLASCKENIWFFGLGEGYVVSEAQITAGISNNLTLTMPEKCGKMS
jgi:hypothetical protein